MSMTITMDDALKAEFSEVCAEIGMSASTAFNIFAKKVVREKRIPFELSSLSDEERAFDREMRMAEGAINEGIRNGYLDYARGNVCTLDELDARRTGARRGLHA